MVTEFFQQEAEYGSFFAAEPGFVCNNLGISEPHKVHRSGCNWLNRSGPASTGLHTSVRKACSLDLDVLVSDLTRRFGPEGTGFTFCKSCFKQ